MKMDQPTNYGMHMPPPYHTQNPNKMNPGNQGPLNLPPPPQVNQYQNQNARPPVFDRSKERQKPIYESIREKRYDFKNEIKKDVK